ncbi:MAG: radical SAM protein [bacterium]|nr:radical SAM protein [bacterium]
MKILLAEAPFSYTDSIIKGERYFPLGIGYIASYIRQSPGRDVKIFIGDMLQFEKAVSRDLPDVVGITCMTNTYPTAAQMVQIVKKSNPRCRIILGGQHVSSVHADVLRDIPEADFLAVGEGEILMDRFLRELVSGKPAWEHVPGLVYRISGGIKEVPVGPVNDHIEQFPFPARDLVDLNQYKSHPQMRFGRSTASMITSRGCPWLCTYCSSHVTMGRKYRFLSADYVLNEIQEIYHRYHINNIILWDDLFTLNHDRVHEICEKIIKSGLNINWFCQSRTDRLNQEIADIMRRAGCKMISFGIESGNEKTLERIRKNVKLDVVTQTIGFCRKAGIRTQGSFILGFPWETKEEMEDTIKFASRSNLDIALFFSFTPYPGTTEWQYVPEEAKPRNIGEWERFVCNNLYGRTWNSCLDQKHMKIMVSKAHWKFYFRFSQIFRMVKRIASAEELVAYIKAAFNLLYSILKILSRNFKKRRL